MSHEARQGDALIDTLHAMMDDWKRRDVDAVLARLADDVVYHYHVGSRPLRGKAAVRRFLEKHGGGQTEIRWRVVNHAQNGDTLLVEGVDDYVDEAGRRIRTPYMGVFEFRDGLISGWRDYLDAALIGAQKSGEPTPEWIAELVG